MSDLIAKLKPTPVYLRALGERQPLIGGSQDPRPEPQFQDLRRLSQIPETSGHPQSSQAKPPSPGSSDTSRQDPASPTPTSCAGNGSTVTAGVESESGDDE